MEFSVRVRQWGSQTWSDLSWRNGVLSGDPVAVKLLEEQARLQEGHVVGPMPSGFSRTNHLENGYSTMALCGEAFAAVEIIRDLPKWIDDTPIGAVN